MVICCMWTGYLFKLTTNENIQYTLNTAGGQMKKCGTASGRINSQLPHHPQTYILCMHTNIYMYMLADIYFFTHFSCFEADLTVNYELH